MVKRRQSAFLIGSVLTMFNKIVTRAAATIAIGVLSYLSYKMVKEINSVDLDDDIWENMNDVYHYHYPKSDSSS